MSWATSVPGDSAWTRIENAAIPRYQWVRDGFYGDLVRWSAVQRIIVSEYDGVTQTAADSYVAAHVSDTNTTSKAVRTSPAGSYKVVKTVDSTSAFTPDT